MLSSLLFYLLLKELYEIVFTLSSSISLDFLCFVLSHLLFNFQGPLPLASGSCIDPRLWRTFILPHFLGFVNTFFKSFFIFLKLFSSRSRFRLGSSPLPQSARLLYQILPHLSTLFFNFFSFFCNLFACCSVHKCVSLFLCMLHYKNAYCTFCGFVI